MRKFPLMMLTFVCALIFSVVSFAGEENTAGKAEEQHQGSGVQQTEAAKQGEPAFQEASMQQEQPALTLEAGAVEQGEKHAAEEQQAIQPAEPDPHASTAEKQE